LNSNFCLSSRVNCLIPKSSETIAHVEIVTGNTVFFVDDGNIAKSNRKFFFANNSLPEHCNLVLELVNSKSIKYCHVFLNRIATLIKFVMYFNFVVDLLISE
jgi:hypothetical protein